MNVLQPLSKEDIMSKAPAVFTKQPHPKVSDKYSFLPTYQLVDDMEKLGWLVSDAKMAITKNKVQKEYGKHMITFFNPDIVIKDDQGEVEAYPQILVQNNHRAWGRLSIEVGVFRMVCSNGLVIKEEGKDFGSYTLRHMGYSFEELKELVNKVVEDLPQVVSRINQFTERIMTPDEQKQFARKAIEIRFNEEKAMMMTDEQINEMLSPLRVQDAGDDLYKVFNRVQESILKGGFDIPSKTKSGTKKVRRITNITKDIELNKELWAIASEFVYS